MNHPLILRTQMPFILLPLNCGNPSAGSSGSQLSSLSPISYIDPGHVFSNVMWAFPSFSGTARARTRGVGIPTALFTDAAPTRVATSHHYLDAPADFFPLCSKLSY